MGSDLAEEQKLTSIEDGFESVFYAQYVLEIVKAMKKSVA